MNNDIKRLHYKRATRNKTGLGIPNNHEGENGDIRITDHLGDIYLFVKYNNRWYNSLMSDGFSVDLIAKK